MEVDLIGCENSNVRDFRRYLDKSGGGNLMVMSGVFELAGL